MTGQSPLHMSVLFQDHRADKGEKRMGIGFEAEVRKAEVLHGRGPRLQGSGRSFAQSPEYRSKQSIAMKAAWQRRHDGGTE